MELVCRVVAQNLQGAPVRMRALLIYVLEARWPIRKRNFGVDSAAAGTPKNGQSLSHVCTWSTHNNAHSFTRADPFYPAALVGTFSVGLVGHKQPNFTAGAEMQETDGRYIASYAVKEGACVMLREAKWTGMLRYENRTSARPTLIAGSVVTSGGEDDGGHVLEAERSLPWLKRC